MAKSMADKTITLQNWLKADRSKIYLFYKICVIIRFVRRIRFIIQKCYFIMHPILWFPGKPFSKSEISWKRYHHLKKKQNTPLWHKSSQSFENSITLCLTLYCLRFICHLWMCICAPRRLRYLWHSHESEFQRVTPSPLPYSPLSTPPLALLLPTPFQALQHRPHELRRALFHCISRQS